MSEWQSNRDCLEGWKERQRKHLIECVSTSRQRTDETLTLTLTRRLACSGLSYYNPMDERVGDEWLIEMFSAVDGEYNLVSMGCFFSFFGKESLCGSITVVSHGPIRA